VPLRLLLDEMFPPTMAIELCAKGHDVRAVADSPEFAGLADEDILIGAAEAGRAVVTANIRDFMPLDGRFLAANRSHAGLIMVSTKTFPQNRSYVPAITNALNALLAADAPFPPGGVTFLARLAAAGQGFLDAEAGQLVGPLVARVAVVPLDPVPADLVRVHGRD
jgi:hypothetical protein